MKIPSGTIGSHELTANAVIVFNVLGLICAGIKARIKLGTLSQLLEYKRFSEYRNEKPRERY